QSTSASPPRQRQPRQCPTASSNWLRLDGKQEQQHYRTLQTMVIVGWIALPLGVDAFRTECHGGDYSPVKGQQRVFGTRGATEVHRALRPYLGNSYQHRCQRPPSMIQCRAMASFFGLVDLRIGIIEPCRPWLS